MNFVHFVLSSHISCALKMATTQAWLQSQLQALLQFESAEEVAPLASTALGLTSNADLKDYLLVRYFLSSQIS